MSESNGFYQVSLTLENRGLEDFFKIVISEKALIKQELGDDQRYWVSRVNPKL